MPLPLDGNTEGNSEWLIPCYLLFADDQANAVSIGEHSTAVEGWEEIWHARIEFDELWSEEV